MVDYKKILLPITDENPCGTDIRESKNASDLYIDLKNKRSILRKAERNQSNNDEIPSFDIAEWGAINTTALDILETYAKDVEITAFLLEGLVRTQGFLGLSQGLKIMEQLLSNYGLKLYPHIDELDLESIDDRLTAISMLSGRSDPGTLIMPIYFCDVLRDNSGKTYNIWDIKTIIGKTNKKQADHLVSKDSILQSADLKSIIDNMDEKFLLSAQSQLINCSNNIHKLGDILFKLFTQKAPSLVNLRNAINYCTSLINNIVSIVKADDHIDDSEDELNKSNGDDHNTTRNNEKLGPTNITPSQLDNASAKKLLGVLIEFFKDSEPHSPIGYSLERALGWSELSLPELLCEMLSEEARSQYCHISGTPFVSINDNDAEAYNDR
jgi:type VI secretion system protein ImpA